MDGSEELRTGIMLVSLDLLLYLPMMGLRKVVRPEIIGLH